MSRSADLWITYFVHIYSFLDGLVTKKGKIGAGHRVQGTSHRETFYPFLPVLVLGKNLALAGHFCVDLWFYLQYKCDCKLVAYVVEGKPEENAWRKGHGVKQRRQGKRQKPLTEKERLIHHPGTMPSTYPSTRLRMPGQAEALDVPPSLKLWRGKR
jgi:hypothetical protein